MESGALSLQHIKSVAMLPAKNSNTMHFKIWNTGGKSYGDNLYFQGNNIPENILPIIGGAKCFPEEQDGTFSTSGYAAHSNMGLTLDEVELLLTGGKIDKPAFEPVSNCSGPSWAHSHDFEENGRTIAFGFKENPALLGTIRELKSRLK